MKKQSHRYSQIRQAGDSRVKVRCKRSQSFEKYIKLANAASAMATTYHRDESEWINMNSLREDAAMAIARSHGQSLSAIFEKLYIWRMECFEPSDNGYIYYNDLFPLSAYFDLKDAVGAGALLQPSDLKLLAHLRSWNLP